MTCTGCSEANCIHIMLLSCKLLRKTRLDLAVLCPDMASDTLKASQLMKRQVLAWIYTQYQV